MAGAAIGRLRLMYQYAKRALHACQTEIRLLKEATLR